MDLTSLTLQYDRSSSGPTKLEIALSTNGGAFVSVFSDSGVEIDDETHTINLAQFQNVGRAEFRLFGYQAENTGGTLDIEQFQTNPSRGIEVRANLTAVPEPSSILFLSLIVCATAGARWNRAAVAGSSRGSSLGLDAQPSERMGAARNKSS
jgi:hypothetical protein